MTDAIPTWTLDCDGGCGRRLALEVPSDATRGPEALFAAAELLGWIVERGHGGGDVCPVCRTVEEVDQIRAHGAPAKEEA